MRSAPRRRKRLPRHPCGFEGQLAGREEPEAHHLRVLQLPDAEEVPFDPDPAPPARPRLPEDEHDRTTGVDDVAGLDLVSLIRDRKTGWLCAPEPESLAAAITQLAASEFLRAGLARAGLAAVEGGTWEAAMAQLAAGYQRSLSGSARKPGPAPLQEVA
jgi:hypothetical protein